MKCSSEMGMEYESAHIFHRSDFVAEGVVAADFVVVLQESERWVVG